jgi:hypothetical protein
MKAIDKVFILEEIKLKEMLKILILKWPHHPREMTHCKKIWDQMKHKYYSTHIKQK